MSKFKIGDRVAKNASLIYDRYENSKEGPLRYDVDNGLSVGVITDVSAAGKITVEWDESYPKIETVETKVLLSEEKGLEKYSELEAEFNATEKELKVKFKEIAKAIREANKVAQKTGHNLADMYDIVDKDLYPAMDAAGWRTSSFNC